ncbi:hypothetical protein AB0P07_03910 [Streptomyces sp. NPDC085944]|uniref:hypothetical protein n=1 Tax=Streptomyces sp. NPDC085944 TaxID=3154962 RepID=UPI00343CC0FC
METKFPPTDVSGVLAAYSVLPPGAFAHAPASPGLARARWAFGDRNRSDVGAGLAGQLKTEELPRIGRLLMRPVLLAEITSYRSPSVRRWGAVQSELVLMADHYTTPQQETLLAAPDLDDTFRRDYREWVAKRATVGRVIVRACSTVGPEFGFRRPRALSVCPTAHAGRVDRVGHEAEDVRPTGRVPLARTPPSLRMTGTVCVAVR